MMADPNDGRILGAAILGPNGSDLIHEIIVALYYRSTVFDFVKIPHLHPTLAEIWTYPAEELVEKIIAGAARSQSPDDLRYGDRFNSSRTRGDVARISRNCALSSRSF